MTKHSRAKREEGAALVIALVILVIFSTITLALMNLGSTSMTATVAAHSQRAQIYAADNAVQEAINYVRSDANKGKYIVGSSTCPGPAVPSIPASNGVNNTGVTYCPLAGSGGSLPNQPQYTLLALSDVNSTTEGIIGDTTHGAGGGTADIGITGNIASNGTINPSNNGAHSDLQIAGDASASNCQNNGQIALVGTHTLNCGVTTPFIDPGSPAAPNAAGYAPAQTTFSNPVAPTCPGSDSVVTFSPGLYTSAPTAPGCPSKPWWFKPGTYYFDFNGPASGALGHVWSLPATAIIVGGTPKNWDPHTASQPPTAFPGSCKTEADGLPSAIPSNFGVGFIFGGDTQWNVGDATVELCAQPTNPSSTTQQIAIDGLNLGNAGATTAPIPPTTNTVTGTAWTSLTSAYSINDAGASASVTMNGTPASPRQSTLMLSTFNVPAQPNGTIISKVTAKVVHRDGAGISNIALIAEPSIGGSGNRQQKLVPMSGSCVTGKLCLRPTAAGEDDIDLTDVLGDPALIAGARISLQVTATATSSTETLDGIVLAVDYVAPTTGALRGPAGCRVARTLVVVDALAGTIDTNDNSCTLLSNTTNSQFYVHGTIYAPLDAQQFVTTGGTPPFIADRGVIARTITIQVPPGHAVSQGFLLASPGNRVVLFEVKIGPRSVLQTVVVFDDSDNTNYGKTTQTLSWDVRRET